MSRIALIAGEGVLAPAIAQALDQPLVYALDHLSPQLPARPFRLERLVPFLDELIDQGVDRVVFAGAIRRPRIEPELFDPRTMAIVPRILMGMQSGDDAALRAVLEVFEETGINILSVDQILPELVPGEGILAGAPGPGDQKDAARAAQIVQGLGDLDIGQGAVVAQGLCLAVEALPGTQAMLEFAGLHVGLRPNPNGPRGLLYKAPKPGQDRRIDLPTIGPDTVHQVARAGLAGIAWQAGGVIVLQRDEAIAAAEAAGLFLWARA
ncbi:MULTISPECIES: LpxI family protein [unclassified Paracoccus (in: a-proteobacteria)]|uniref:LpxI family protein n=1 Tax=unclassified Paracoccus (in: a-proteobacteria) TaxID=2688777 RepID=UPI0012B3AFF9|nr:MULTISPECIES: UDP-2,3-diacylglucosamine diphosphatase LpxI [unclassified Paracoccus (in: a-proteobacteria)]UXU73924.1 UDP-2,3-diacylglucosamine diphosphatase LpxI [Paracoccus sp. SMMA_5]UXU79811.1 UDP-2,3-diacylglucosamine diphosphatase LpxI [Paracoccus sp. SMMA_5_TC]